MNTELQFLWETAAAIGLTVAHSVWQIALVSGIFWLISTLFDPKPMEKYALALSAMLVCAGWSMATFWGGMSRPDLLPTAFFEIKEAENGPGIAQIFEKKDAQKTVSGSRDGFFSKNRTVGAALSFFQKNSFWLGAGWVLGFLFFGTKLVGGWFFAQKIGREATPAPPVFAESCTALAPSMGIRRAVRLAESALVAAPVTLGFLRPVVLFPVGMLLQLPPAQAEALLLHELAHIHRGDFLVNLGQILIETVFFYHPLLRWLSREARTARECCCDDAVLRRTNDRLGYARTLVELKTMLSKPSNPFAMSATTNLFADRIRRIAEPKFERGMPPFAVLFLGLPLILFFVKLNAVSAGFLSKTAVSAPFLSKKEPIGTVLPPQILPKIAAQMDSLPPRAAHLPTQNPASPAPKTTAPTSGDPILPTEKPVPQPGLAAISSEKLNVLYIGVDNPLTIAVPGVRSENLRVTMEGNGNISGSDGHFVARVSNVGEARIFVFEIMGGAQSLVSTKIFRCKRIPDPVPTLGGNRSGAMSKAEFRGQKNLLALLEHFDFGAECAVVSATVAIIKKQHDPVEYLLKSGEFPAEIRAVLEAAEPGDRFFFDNILAKCDGDDGPRNLYGLAFKIN